MSALRPIEAKYGITVDGSLVIDQDRNLTVNNLTVNGVSTIISAEETLIADNIITLNSNNLNGGISSGRITTLGAGYTAGWYRNVPLTGGAGSGATANITIASAGVISTLGTITAGSGYRNGTYYDVPLFASSGTTPVSGAVLFCEILSGGTGYTTTTGVSVVGGSGTGLTVNTTASGGAVTAVVINAAGSQYNVGDIINISGGNQDAVLRVAALTGFVTANITVAGGAVTAVNLVSRGSGYDNTSVLTCLNTFLGGTGSGFSVPVSAVVTNAVSYVELVNNGTAYLATNTISAATANVGGGSPGTTFVYTVDTVTTGVAPTENAGIEVARGTSANVAILWNETTDTWQFTNDGSTYSDFSAPDTLASVVARGSSSNGVVTLNIDDGVTNNLTRSLNVDHTTTGTAAAGIASGLALRIENAAGTTITASAIDSISTAVTSTTESADISIKTISAGTLAERLKIHSGGNLTIGTSGTNTTVTVNNASAGSVTLASQNSGTANVFNTNVTTGNLFGAGTTVSIGAASGTTTINNNATVTLDLAVNGGDITSSATTFNLLNSTVTTLNLAGAGTAISIGAASGTTTINNANTVVTGDLAVNGGDLTSSAATFNLLNTTVTTANLFGAGTAIVVGATTGTTTIRNKLIVGGNLEIDGNIIQASDGNTNITLTSNTLTTFAGDIRVNGNDIQASDGNTNITLTGNTLTTFAGDIKVNGNDIQSSTATAITLSGSDVTVAGDLTVTGNDIKSSTATALTLSGANVTVAGDLTVTGNDISSSTAVALTLSGANVTIPGDLGVNGGDITSTATTFNLLNGTVTTLNLAGAGTAISIGAGTGTTTINHNATVTLDLAVNGGDITSSATTFNLLNSTVTTGNLFGASTTVNIATSAASASTLDFGAAVSGNTVKIGGTAAGTINIIPDGFDITGTVNLFGGSTNGLTTGTLQIGKTGIASGNGTTVMYNNMAGTSTSITTIASTAQTATHTFPTATFRSAKMYVQVTQGSNYHNTEVTVTHDGTNVWMTEYGTLVTGGYLASFDADISGGNVRLLVTMNSNSSATVEVFAIQMTVAG